MIAGKKPMKILLIVTAGLLLTTGTACTQTAVRAVQIDHDFMLDANPDKALWRPADEVVIDRSWDGGERYPDYATRVKLLWSDTNLYLLFVAACDEPVIDRGIDPDDKGDYWGIWEKDVVEVFIAGSRHKHTYYEFVVSPINQRIDLSHRTLPRGEKESDPGYTSGWETAAAVNRTAGVYTVEMRIPLWAIGVEPKAGEVCQFNLFRCAGTEPDRIYLAMNPTFTVVPNFHVRRYFSELILD